MNSNCIIIVLVCSKCVKLIVTCWSWSELNIDVFAHSSWYHSFFLITDLKIRCLGWQNVQPLWSWWIIDNSYFKSMSLIYLKTHKFYNWRRSLENSIWTYCIKYIMSCNRIHRNTFSSINKFFLYFKYLLRLRDRDLIHFNSCCPLRHLWVLIHPYFILYYLIWRVLIIRINIWCESCLREVRFWYTRH